MSLVITHSIFALYVKISYAVISVNVLMFSKNASAYNAQEVAA